MAKAIAGGELFVLAMIKIINSMNKKILYILIAIIPLISIYYFLVPKYSFPIIPSHKAGPFNIDYKTISNPYLTTTTTVPAIVPSITTTVPFITTTKSPPTTIILKVDCSKILLSADELQEITDKMNQVAKEAGRLDANSLKKLFTP